MSNTAENLAAVERELAADVAMAEGRADAEDATLPEPAADFIYLDYAATAPLCAEAAGAMAPFQVPGPANLAVNANANALYGVGRAAFDLLESARRRAARALGASGPRIIKKHLLPNCIGQIVVTTCLQIPSAIFLESFLSFLGVGVSTPMTSLGSMASEALGGMTTYPYRLLFPALILSIMILSFNLVGDGLRDALDPKLKK